MQKLSARYAAIAQSVERILGKDEVASSNLASSSKKSLEPLRVLGFLLFCAVCCLPQKPTQKPTRGIILQVRTPETAPKTVPGVLFMAYR